MISGILSSTHSQTPPTRYGYGSIDNSVVKGEDTKTDDLEALAKEMLKGKRIIFLGEILPDGFGDLITMVDRIEAFRRRYDLSNEQIGMKPYFTNEAQREHPLIQRILSDYPSNDINNNNASLVIGGPVLPSNLVVYNTRDDTVPVIAAPAYGGERPVWENTLQKGLKRSGCSNCLTVLYPGIYEDGDGIIIDPVDKAKSQRLNTSEERLSELQYVSSSHQKAILGEPFSPSAIKKFDKSSKLYTGYAKSSNTVIGFIRSVLLFQEKINEKRKPVFCFIGNCPENPEEILHAFSERKVEVIRIGSPGKERDPNSDVTVIAGTVDHSQRRRLFFAGTRHMTLSSADSSSADSINTGSLPITQDITVRSTTLMVGKQNIFIEKLTNTSFHDSVYNWKERELNPEALSDIFVDIEGNPDRYDEAVKTIQEKNLMKQMDGAIVASLQEG